jgi:AbrB family looped-hinge helix DNA binding protein
MKYRHMVGKSLKMLGTQQRIAANGTITVPKWVRDQLNKKPGSRIKVFFPVDQNEDYSGLTKDNSARLLEKES